MSTAVVFELFNCVRAPRPKVDESVGAAALVPFPSWPTANQHDESRRDASVTRTITSTFRRLLFPFRLFSIRNRFGLVLHVSRTPVVAQFKTTEQISLIAGQGVSCWRTKGARARPLFDCWDVKKRKFQTAKKNILAAGDNVCRRARLPLFFNRFCWLLLLVSRFFCFFGQNEAGIAFLPVVALPVRARALFFIRSR